MGALRLLFALAPSSEYDVERAIWTSLPGSRNGGTLETEEVGVRYICRCDDVVLTDDRLSGLQITNPWLEMPDEGRPPAIPTATPSTSRISESEAYQTTAYSLILMLHAKP